MSDTFDDGYEESWEDGHEFADRFLSDAEPVPPEHAMHRSEDDAHFNRDAAELNISPGTLGQARRIDRRVIEAKFPGTCVACRAAIRVNDPVTNDGDGWRHAGCGVSAKAPFVEPF